MCTMFWVEVLLLLEVIEAYDGEWSVFGDRADGGVVGSEEEEVTLGTV